MYCKRMVAAAKTQVSWKVWLVKECKPRCGLWVWPLPFCLLLEWSYSKPCLKEVVHGLPPVCGRAKNYNRRLPAGMAINSAWTHDIIGEKEKMWSWHMESVYLLHILAISLNFILRIQMGVFDISYMYPLCATIIKNLAPCAKTNWGESAVSNLLHKSLHISSCFGSIWTAILRQL